MKPGRPPQRRRSLADAQQARARAEVEAAWAEERAARIGAGVAAWDPDQLAMLQTLKVNARTVAKFAARGIAVERQGDEVVPVPKYRPAHEPRARTIVTERSGGLCEVRGPACAGWATAMHHRWQPGRVDTAANLLHTCDWCHNLGGSESIHGVGLKTPGGLLVPFADGIPTVLWDGVRGWPEHWGPRR